MEMINALTKANGLRVMARTSAFALSRKGLDIREIGAGLNVDHILDGSVRRSGNRLRVTAQLVKVAGGYHLWSESYDRELAPVSNKTFADVGDPPINVLLVAPF
jgi:adenylate cyclase